MAQPAIKKLSDYKLNPNNPRFIKDDRFLKLVQSIKEFPAMMELRPMIADKTKIIIGGNQRYRACRELGYTEVAASWIRDAHSLTEEERRRFILIDNEEFGETDWDIIANSWDAMEVLEWGIVIPQLLPPDQVSFTPAAKTGLKMKITFESEDQVKQITAKLDKMGIKYKLS